MATAASKKWLKDLRQMARLAPTPESKAHYEALIAKQVAYQAEQEQRMVAFLKAEFKGR